MAARIGTCAVGFGKHLIDHGVYPNNGNVTQPQNWDEISSMVEQPRLPLIPPGFYAVQSRAFQEAEEALNECERFSPYLQAAPRLSPPPEAILFAIWRT